MPKSNAEKAQDFRNRKSRAGMIEFRVWIPRQLKPKLLRYVEELIKENEK